MRKFLAFILMCTMLLTSGCTKSQEQVPPPVTDDVSSENTVKETDCEIIEHASDTYFNEMSFEWNGYKITVQKPVFTGVRIDEVYSYKDYYAFNNDGLVSIETADGYLTINKSGETVEEFADSPVRTDKAREYSILPQKTEGRPISEKTMIIQTGESGDYKQQLHTYDGEPLSDYFDYISYFYNGLALVGKDNKLGIIDESGTTLLEPTISYDKITYPPTERYFFVQFMDGDAFIIPICGVLAVVNITREKLDSEERLPKENYYTYAPDMNKPEERAYAEFIKKFTDRDGYSVKDLDGDGVSELIISKHPNITVYGYNGEVFEIGSKEFPEGTLQLLYSDKYSGIIVFTIGGGANRYRYMTVKDSKLSLDNIWNDYYAYDSDVITVKSEEFTDDKELINESKVANENFQRIEFLPIEN